MAGHAQFKFVMTECSTHSLDGAHIMNDLFLMANEHFQIHSKWSYVFILDQKFITKLHCLIKIVNQMVTIRISFILQRSQRREMHGGWKFVQR